VRSDQRSNVYFAASQKTEIEKLGYFEKPYCRACPNPFDRHTVPLPSYAFLVSAISEFSFGSHSKLSFFPRRFRKVTEKISNFLKVNLDYELFMEII